MSSEAAQKAGGGAMSTRDELAQSRSWGLGWMTRDREFVQPPRDTHIDELLQNLLEDK